MALDTSAVHDSELRSRLPPDVASWDRLHRPIWIFDPVACRGLYANPKALELWDADSLAELLSRDFSQLSEAVRSRVKRLALATADGGTVGERWSFFPRGKPVTVQALISSLALTDGTAALLFEAAPATVEEGELRAVEALRHTSSLITLFDAKGRASFVNPAAFSAYGDTGHGFADRFLDPERGAAAFVEVMAGEVLAALEQVRTGQGERFHYLDARRVPDPVTGLASVLLSERDVTAQVEAERALRSAEERADVAEAKQRFLANISHELRTPLNSVLGFADLLRAGELSPVQARHVERIAEGGNAVLRIVNDVIDLSELDGGEIALEPGSFAPAALLEDALNAVAADAGVKGLELQLDVPEDLPTHLIGDARRIGTVLCHLLTNAVKFTERGAVLLELAFRPHGAGAVEIEIGVADTGPGLTPAAQARLFRHFSPGDDSIRKQVAGAGLGLAICKALVTLMGGEIGVESLAGEGSRFWVRLVLPLPEAGTSQAAPEQDRPEDRLLNILYADDHENNRALVRAMLESQGHRCDTVNDGAEAVGAVREGFYDLVLMDIQMPVQDGVSATVAIRSGAGPQAKVPILALTANTLTEQREAYAAAGLNDCIAKPLSMADLFTKVAYWADVSEVDAPLRRSA